MNIQPAVAGSMAAVGSQQELYKDRGSALQARIHSAEIKARTFGKFTASAAGSNKESSDIRSTMEDLEHLSLVFKRKLKFHVDQESREIIVKVIDSETDKVIRELPPKELQRLHSSLKEAIGFLFDEQV
jgi:flagellar protein FlaG